MFHIIINTNKGEIKKEYMDKVLLATILEDVGLKQNKPCGGNGICGKCKVKVDGKMVLSCITYIDKDCYIDNSTTQEDIQGLTDGYIVEFDKKPLIESGYGLAIDIGTTTIAGYLYKFPECECVKKIGFANTQAEYGADVISRIEYSNNGGLSKLQEKVKEQIERLTDGRNIEKYVITGNTTMLHLLTGLDTKGIARAPFTPMSLFGEWKENVYFPKCISAYVGADITTAILASGMTKNSTSFLVDIGTNGEMALWHNGKLVCCSTAAGPAFEGAGISQGTIAVSGAINKVYIENGEIKYTTIDGEKAIGICGTGLIDVIACMTTLKIIDETGYLEDDFEIGDSNIYITAKDVRQVQLAKSAIRSGIDTLLHECNISYEDLEKFYIAGGFGSFIDKNSAAKIGLIPKEVIDKVVIIGNAAGNGAAMILQSEECLVQSEKNADLAETVELSNSSFFMEKYVDNIMF